MLFGFGSMMKLLHHYAVSSISSGANIYCSCIEVFLVPFLMVLVVHMLHAWVVPDMASHCFLICNKNVPLKHPITVNTSP